LSFAFFRRGRVGLSIVDVSESTDISRFGVASTSIGVRLIDAVGERGSLLNTLDRPTTPVGVVHISSFSAVVVLSFSNSAKSHASVCSLLTHEPILVN